MVSLTLVGFGWSSGCRVTVTQRQLTAIITREGDGYTALSPEVDVASQGDTIAEARANLQEALELFFETASETEIAERLHGEVYVTSININVAAIG